MIKINIAYSKQKGREDITGVIEDILIDSTFSSFRDFQDGIFKTIIRSVRGRAKSSVKINKVVFSEQKGQQDNWVRQLNGRTIPFKLIKNQEVKNERN